jgi:hypothetical protein
MGSRVTWSSIAFVAVLCFALRVAVPLALAGRGLPLAVERRRSFVLALAAAALLTALLRLA